jgi:uncharacterized coiled-coil protein SlyX
MTEDFQKRVLETLARLDDRTARLDDRTARLDARTASIETTLNEVSVAVATLTIGQRDLKADNEAIKDRLDKIEKHTGLVKA